MVVPAHRSTNIRRGEKNRMSEKLSSIETIEIINAYFVYESTQCLTPVS